MMNATITSIRELTVKWILVVTCSACKGETVKRSGQSLNFCSNCGAQFKRMLGTGINVSDADDDYASTPQRHCLLCVFYLVASLLAEIYQ
jgi:ribosomal protein L37AE/L43A